MVLVCINLAELNFRYMRIGMIQITNTICIASCLFQITVQAEYGLCNWRMDFVYYLCKGDLAPITNVTLTHGHNVANSATLEAGI
jgi:hypothetical protein